MEHALPLRGRMAPRQSSQTGRREMLVSDAPQMRQSEGNSTAKRLAAAWLGQARGLCKTIKAPTSGTESPLARILSSLLLKTASIAPHGLDCRAERKHTHVRTALQMQYSGVDYH